jgi:hypothetical protein
VDADRNPRFHRLLQAFHELTGCPENWGPRKLPCWPSCCSAQRGFSSTWH